MANKGKKVSTYELELAARKGASDDLEKLGVGKGKGWDKTKGQNGKRRKGSIERQN